MKKRFLIISILLVVFSYQQLSAQNASAYEVKAISSMKKVMKGTDLSANVSWDTLPKAHLFAVAPMNRLKGEVTIIDGKMHASQVDAENYVTIRNDFEVKSPFTAYTYVAKWESFKTTLTTNSVADIEDFIEKFAKSKGYNLNKPFPFMIKGNFYKLTYHIISKPENQIKHNHKLHKKAKRVFDLQNVNGELLGFYSQKHEGVFTHKDKFIHVHFVNENNAGHLDALNINEQQIEVLLPAK